VTRLHNHVKHNVIAYLALFVALGGTSYAAINLPAGSVGNKQLRNGSVTAAKLAKGAVNASSLNSKTIAGHIAMWAQIGAGGQVISSSPRATVAPFAFAGIERVSWKRTVSRRCAAIANVTNVLPIPLAASANATTPVSHAGVTESVISTFDGSGTTTPENVIVVVICP
jgi:hypothetical protein